MTAPATSPYADLAMKRAAEIHAENRSLFDFGPPPYETGVDVSHTLTGRSWTVRISDHIDPAGIDVLLALIQSCAKADGAEVMAFGLAYIAACTEMGKVAAAMEMRPVGGVA